MIVEVNDHRGQDQSLLAPFDRAALDGALETVEEVDQVLGRSQTAHVFGEAVDPLVRRAERARRTTADEVVAEGLFGPPLGTRSNRRCQFLGSMMLVRHGILTGWIAPESASEWSKHMPERSVARAQVLGRM